jgi:hypothetical protein
MPHSAKDIRVAPISGADAVACIKRLHYSGKVVKGSQLHLGVFLDGVLEGAMQFGPSLDKRKTMPLVTGTAWNGFIELNRMAFSEKLPRNSESRALGVALRMIKKNYPQFEWVISFADGTQCGDGTIYRASGFVLTGIRKNSTVWAAPDGMTFSNLGLRELKGDKRREIITKLGATDQRRPQRGQLLAEINKRREVISKVTVTKAQHVLETGAASMRPFQEAGFYPLPGFQFRYVYFLNPAARARLSVPEIPFSKIDEMGAGMYKGESITRGKQAMAEYPSAQRRGSGDHHAPKKAHKKTGPGAEPGPV